MVIFEKFFYIHYFQFYLFFFCFIFYFILLPILFCILFFILFLISFFILFLISFFILFFILFLFYFTFSKEIGKKSEKIKLAKEILVNFIKILKSINFLELLPFILILEIYFSGFWCSKTFLNIKNCYILLEFVLVCKTFQSLINLIFLISVNNQIP